MDRIPHKEFIEMYKENAFISSPLVRIPADKGIIIDMQYPKLGMKHAIKECLHFQMKFM